MTALGWWCALRGGRTVTGTTAEAFEELTRGESVLCFGIDFGEGLSRQGGGHRCVYMLVDTESGEWTIDDDPDANTVIAKYPAPGQQLILRPGATVLESELRVAQQQLQAWVATVAARRPVAQPCGCVEA